MAIFRHDKSLLNLKVIYKVSSPTGKVYIGQTCNWAKRRRSYQIYRCKSQPKLYASLIKHGQELHVFEIIHTLPPDIEPSMITQYEQVYMDLYSACGINMLNVCPSANSMSGFRHSEEAKRKMSLARKGKKTTSDYQRSRIAESNKQRGMSEESRKKIAASKIGKIPWNKGITHTEEARNKISIAAKGKKRKPFTEETRAKMSIAFRGRQTFLGKTHTDETKRKMSEGMKNYFKKKKDANNNTNS